MLGAPVATARNSLSATDPIKQPPQISPPCGSSWMRLRASGCVGANTPNPLHTAMAPTRRSSFRKQSSLGSLDGGLPILTQAGRTLQPVSRGGGLQEFRLSMFSGSSWPNSSRFRSYFPVKEVLYRPGQSNTRALGWWLHPVAKKDQIKATRPFSRRWHKE